MNGGTTNSGDAEGGRGSNGGRDGSATSGSSGAAKGGSVRNNGGSITNTGTATSQSFLPTLLSHEYSLNSFQTHPTELATVVPPVLEMLEAATLVARNVPHPTSRLNPRFRSFQLPYPSAPQQYLNQFKHLRDSLFQCPKHPQGSQHLRPCQSRSLQ